jgi:hypothetical protein
MKLKRLFEHAEKPELDESLDDYFRELLCRSSKAVPTPTRFSTQIAPAMKRPRLLSLAIAGLIVSVLVGVGITQSPRNRQRVTVVAVQTEEPTTLPETMPEMPQATDAQGRVVESALPRLFAAAAKKCIPILASSDLDDPDTWIATTMPFAVMNINARGVTAEQLIRVPAAIYDLSVASPQALPDTEPPTQASSEIGIAMFPNRVTGTGVAVLSVGPVPADSVVGGAIIVDIDAWDGTTWILVARAQVALDEPKTVEVNAEPIPRCPTAWFDPKKIDTLPNKSVNLAMGFNGFTPQGTPPMLTYHVDLPRLVTGWYRASTASPVTPSNETLQTNFRIG